MTDPFTLDVQKEILSRYMSSVEGRHKELLEVVIERYPRPISDADLKHALSMSGCFALSSALRNSKILFEVHKCYGKDKRRWCYGLDDTPVERARLIWLMNALV